jgi:hypothetical protein
MEILHFLQDDRVLLFDVGEEFREEWAKFILGGGLSEDKPCEFTDKFALVTAQDLKEELLDIVVGLHTEDIEFIEDDCIENLIVALFIAVVESTNIAHGRAGGCRCGWHRCGGGGRTRYVRGRCIGEAEW